MEPKILCRALLAVSLLGAVGQAAFAGQERTATGFGEQGERGGREVVTPSGLKYTDLRIGQGDEAATGKIIEVHYVGWLENGTKFDSSRDRKRPLTFRLGAGDTPKGWDEGLAGMKVGGKRKLVIPPELGFGRQGVGSVVPPNAVLFYEFELLEVR